MKKFVPAFLFLWLSYFIAVPFAHAQSSRNISIDPRIELLAVVQFLSLYQLITSLDFPYKRSVSEYFSPFRNHPAVSIFKQMSALSFNFDAPPAAMLFLSNPPDLDIQIPFSDYIKQRAGGEERLNQFVEALRDFAVESQFMVFFSAHEVTYLQIVDNTNYELEWFDYLTPLETYCGWKLHSYNLILAPLFSGGFGPRIERPDGTYDAYVIIGPSRIKNDLPDFGDKQDLVNLLWHEFGHSYVNPLCDKFIEQINKYSRLYQPISNWMKMQAYDTWRVCVIEHINRAITIRLNDLEFGSEAATKRMNYDKSCCFLYIGFLCERLELYEIQRGKYPTLQEFFPELLKVFQEISENSVFFCFPRGQYFNNSGRVLFKISSQKKRSH
jgi:hypothetical protein